MARIPYDKGKNKENQEISGVLEAGELRGGGCVAGREIKNGLTFFL